VNKGGFITIEGADGAGKTTQLNFVEEWISQRGIELVRTREPGGTALGERLRQILLAANDLSISDEAELLMIFAARQQHLDQLIIPALEAGKWVLSDRFTDATYAYQGAGRGIAFERIEVLENWVQKGLQPDLTRVLDVNVETGMARSAGRGLEADRFERQAITFKEAVRLNYLQRAAQMPERIHVIDASGSVQSVQHSLVAVLEGFWDSRTNLAGLQ